MQASQSQSGFRSVPECQKQLRNVHPEVGLEGGEVVMGMCLGNTPKDGGSKGEMFFQEMAT